MALLMYDLGKTLPLNQQQEKKVGHERNFTARTVLSKFKHTKLTFIKESSKLINIHLLKPVCIKI